MWQQLKQNKNKEFSSITGNLRYVSLIDEQLKGLIELVIDVLGLATFDDKVIDDRVDPEVQLLDSLLAVLSPVKGNKKELVYSVSRI